MENENSNETYQKAIEKHVLEGLVSFFENPDNFDNIVLSARYGIEQLTKKGFAETCRRLQAPTTGRTIRA